MLGECHRKEVVAGLVELSMSFKDIAVLSTRCFVFETLYGHIVDAISLQVRYNHSRAVIATSGVEKVVKLWSAFPLPQARNDSRESGRDRQVYSHSGYILKIFYSLD